MSNVRCLANKTEELTGLVRSQTEYQECSIVLYRKMVTRGHIRAKSWVSSLIICSERSHMLSLELFTFCRLPTQPHCIILNMWQNIAHIHSMCELFDQRGEDPGLDVCKREECIQLLPPPPEADHNLVHLQPCYVPLVGRGLWSTSGLFWGDWLAGTLWATWRGHWWTHSTSQTTSNSVLCHQALSPVIHTTSLRTTRDIKAIMNSKKRAFRKRDKEEVRKCRGIWKWKQTRLKTLTIIYLMSTTTVPFQSTWFNSLSQSLHICFATL